VPPLLVPPPPAVGVEPPELVPPEVVPPAAIPPAGFPLPPALVGPPELPPVPPEVLSEHPSPQVTRATEATARGNEKPGMKKREERPMAWCT
jgi:hypothetical protein